MEYIQHILSFLVHIDDYLIAFVSHYGVWTYVILFSIIFCETGLVVFPFLPGDSLLFAAGSIAATENEPLNIGLLFFLLTLASILGNKLNYLIGVRVGPRVFKGSKYRLFSKKHLEDAHRFYEKHGGKTIILARFVPILRTFAPFVAGIAYMSLSQFSLYNIVSGLLWIGTLLYAGYFFGGLPFIKDNFSIVVYAVVALSLLPPLFAFLYRRFIPDNG
ncbi:MAG: DedA family protein [Gammaproteobacteria bacterium]|nr:DedA family protein [Gammaproteobacteria bacterium]